MNDSVLDYTYDQTQRLVRKDRDDEDSIFEEKTVKYFYNVSGGNFSKTINFLSKSEEIMLSISGQASAQTSVVVKLNNTTVFKSNFTSLIFLNEYIKTDETNALEITISSSGAINNLHIILRGEVDLDVEKPLFAFSSTYKVADKAVSTYSSVNALLGGLFDYKSPSYDKIYDICFNFSASNTTKGDFAILYKSSSGLNLLNVTKSKSVVITTDVDSACFIPTNAVEYMVVYVKNGKTSAVYVNSNMEITQTISVTCLAGVNVTKVVSICADSPLDYFIAFSGNTVYTVGANFNNTGADVFNGKGFLNVCQANDVSAFYNNTKLYLYCLGFGEVKVVTLVVSTGVSYYKDETFKNYNGGFLLNGESYLYGTNTVDNVSNE